MPRPATGGRQKGTPKTGGRQKGTPNKHSDIRIAAQAFGLEALDRLRQLMDSCDGDVSLKACNAILDRGYGKPAQTIAGDPNQPLEHNVVVVDAFTRRIAEMAENG